MSEKALLPPTPDEVAPVPEEQEKLLEAEASQTADQPEPAQEQSQTRSERLKDVGLHIGETALKRVRGVVVGGKSVAQKAGRTAKTGAEAGVNKTRELKARSGVALGGKLHESSSRKQEKLARNARFYRSLGDRAISSVAPSVIDGLTPVPPRTFIQRGRAIKLESTIRKHEHKAKVDAWRESFFKDTPYHVEVDKKGTQKVRAEAYAKIEKAYKQGAITGEQYVAQLTEAAKITRTRPDKKMRKHSKKLEKSAEGVVEAGQPRLTRRAHNTSVRINNRIQRTGLNMTQKNQKKLARLEVPNTTSLTDEEPEVLQLDTLVREPLTPQPQLSAIERLRQMRTEGVLPQVEEVPTTDGSEMIFKPVPSPIAPEISKPTALEEAILDTASVERMAEVAYIAAKDEVFRQIDEEDAKRATEGKPALTKEEKAEVWKNERVIRQQLLATLSPDDRSLVNKQIGELMKADKAARKAGEEQLRDKRRREAREKAAARQASRSSRTTPQRSGETVQQRARREREEQRQREAEAAASVNANAQRTALDL